MKDLVKIVLAIGLFLSLAAVQPRPADARDRGGEVAAGVIGGVIGLGLLGAAAEAERRRDYGPGGGYYARGGGCYAGPRECEIQERPCYYNDYGDRICPAPRRRCYRREVCD